MRFLKILPLALMLTGCASTSENEPSADSSATVQSQQEIANRTSEDNAENSSSNAEKERFVCHSTQTTGSNRKTRVCRKVSN